MRADRTVMQDLAEYTRPSPNKRVEMCKDYIQKLLRWAKFSFWLQIETFQRSEFLQIRLRTKIWKLYCASKWFWEMSFASWAWQGLVWLFMQEDSDQNSQTDCPQTQMLNHCMASTRSKKMILATRKWIPCMKHGEFDQTIRFWRSKLEFCRMRILKQAVEWNWRLTTK